MKGATPEIGRAADSASDRQIAADSAPWRADGDLHAPPRPAGIVHSPAHCSHRGPSPARAPPPAPARLWHGRRPQPAKSLPQRHHGGCPRAHWRAPARAGRARPRWRRRSAGSPAAQESCTESPGAVDRISRAVTGAPRSSRPRRRRGRAGPSRRGLLGRSAASRPGRTGRPARAPAERAAPGCGPAGASRSDPQCCPEPLARRRRPPRTQGFSGADRHGAAWPELAAGREVGEARRKPTIATVYSAAAKASISAAGVRPARSATASRSAPKSPPKTAGTRQIRPSAAPSAGAAASSSTVRSTSATSATRRVEMYREGAVARHHFHNAGQGAGFKAQRRARSRAR